MKKEKKNNHMKGRKDLNKAIDKIWEEIPYKSEKRRKAKSSKKKV